MGYTSNLKRKRVGHVWIRFRPRVGHIKPRNLAEAIRGKAPDGGKGRDKGRSERREIA